MRGITQLRWATFGTPSTVNAQPHLDSDGDLVGAHNGNVVNNVELRLQFAAEGMTVRSENDGESCVHAVERWFDRGFDMVEAIRRAYGDLQGDYAFVIGHVEDDKLYAIKKGSGLVVGLTDDTTFVSSDLPSILPLTRRILRIQDGEIAILSAGSVELVRVADGAPIQREPEEIVETMEAAQKGGYPHFMLKEIHEQPQVARELLHLLDASVDVAGYVEKMRKARHLYLVACGTSYHACMLGAVYLARLAGRAAVPVLAPQFIAQYGPALGPEDVGVFVSQSRRDQGRAQRPQRRPGARRRGAVAGQRHRLDAHGHAPTATCPWRAATRSRCRPPRRSSTRWWRFSTWRCAWAGTRRPCSTTCPGSSRRRSSRWSPRSRPSKRPSCPGTTPTAWATAPPTRSPWRAPSSSRRSPTSTARGCSPPSSSTGRSRRSPRGTR